MRLTTADAPADLGPFARLNGHKEAPVAVAVSGGGDSVALLHMAAAWARREGRRLLALTVDHGLQPQGAAWARFAAERARAVGAAHRTLVWTGPKPSAGLQAAARTARHALIAEAARTAGARVVVMGHTADDVMESALMAEDGASSRRPRAWAPSPAWPEGRGVFLLRPLLGVRRAALRAWLEAQALPWIEDPANDDPRFARTFARRRLADGAKARPACDRPERPAMPEFRQGVGGELVLPRAALREPGGRRLLAALCLCAAGGTRPPRGAALERLLTRLCAPGKVAATLAGARVEAGGELVTVCREAGEFARTPLDRTPLPADESVFDGRFELQAAEAGWTVCPLRGLASRLPDAERRKLAHLPAAVRGALPATVGPGGAFSCPVLADSGPIVARALAGERFFAAMGGVADEAALWRVAKRMLSP